MVRAVVYPASDVGSEWPVPTWKLLTLCQSIQAAADEPEELSATRRDSAILWAMMG
jgi:hypothetical protein